MITVTCRKRDAKIINSPKFSEFNYMERNENGFAEQKTRDISNDEYAPNGQYNRRHLRQLNPDLKKLSGLAKFLAENLDGSCWASIHGQNSINPYQKPFLITLTSRYTQPEIWIKLKTMSEQNAKSYGDSYGLNSKPATLSNYTMPIIEPSESDEDYFIRVADLIHNIDGLVDSIASVEIGGKKYEASND